MCGDDDPDLPSPSLLTPRAASELSSTTSRSAPAATFCPPEKDLSREPQCRPALTCSRRRNRWHRRHPGRVAPFSRPRSARVPCRRLINFLGFKLARVEKGRGGGPRSCTTRSWVPIGRPVRRSHRALQQYDREWVRWFNADRLLSSIDHLSPIDYETRRRGQCPIATSIPVVA